MFIVIGDEEAQDEYNTNESSDENQVVSDGSSNDVSGSSDNFSSCKSSDFDDLMNINKDNYSSNQAKQKRNRRRRNNKKNSTSPKGVIIL